MALTLEISDFVATVTIDNPPVNAADPSWDMAGVFDSFNDNNDVRVAILTASGTKHFCTGGRPQRWAALASGEHGEDDPNAPRPTDTAARRGGYAFEEMLHCSVPVIGAVNGHALGGGLAIAACCDFLVASENAAFGLPEVGLGLLGGAGHFLRMFPQNWTRYANYTTRRITAEEAFRLGALIKVVPPKELLAATREIALEIADKPPIAVSLAKNALNFIEDNNLPLLPGYKYESAQTWILQGYEDALEAKKAWMEKRRPVYKNR
jgi:enoyl-CoA hydratase